MKIKTDGDFMQLIGRKLWLDIHSKTQINRRWLWQGTSDMEHRFNSIMSVCASSHGTLEGDTDLLTWEMNWTVAAPYSFLHWTGIGSLAVVLCFNENRPVMIHLWFKDTEQLIIKLGDLIRVCLFMINNIAFMWNKRALLYYSVEVIRLFSFFSSFGPPFLFLLFKYNV